MMVGFVSLATTNRILDRLPRYGRYWGSVTVNELAAGVQDPPMVKREHRMSGRDGVILLGLEAVLQG